MKGPESRIISLPGDGLCFAKPLFKMAVSEPIISTHPGEGSQAPAALPENEPVSKQKGTWRGYIWDSWDRTAEVRVLVMIMLYILDQN